MKKPHYVSTYIVNVGNVSTPQAQDLTQRLLAVTGVTEATVMADEGVAYLKIDKHTVDKQALDALVLSV